MKKEARLVGLTGTNCAGKGEVSAFFEKKGYAYFSLSDLIREELRKAGKEASRDNLIKMGNELREKNGYDILARRVMKKVKGRSVIDSIRHPQEVEYLRKQKDFILLAVDAPADLRYERSIKRGREESASTLEEFIKKEAEEMTDRAQGQQLHTCLKMADFLVINDGSLEDLHRKLEELS
jgi:dephospho-CoA kinase